MFIYIEYECIYMYEKQKDENPRNLMDGDNKEGKKNIK